MSATGSSLALVGDYSPDVLAHRAIPRALARVAAETRREITWRWIETAAIREVAHDLAEFSAVWLVPASPYQNMAGAIDAIRWARETRRPFLGTCGGFQHAVIEYARNVAGLTAADHTESNPGASVPLIAPLRCALVEEVGSLRFEPGSLIHQAYQTLSAREGYHCRFGFNPTYRIALEAAGLRFTAFDERGEIRAAELSREDHPFFVGTLFQPERAALRNVTPPLIRAFVQAIAAHENPPH